MIMSEDRPAALPESFDAWRISDAMFAKAYQRTGDRGRAFIKSAIAAAFQACQPTATASVAISARFHGGETRSEETTPRPWYALALGSEVESPAQLVAALIPAVAARIPHVLVFRPKARSGWPHTLLTALELCGVEQVFSPSMRDFESCLGILRDNFGRGGLACLGAEPFWKKVAAFTGSGVRTHWLASPGQMGQLVVPGIAWDQGTIEFAHAGVELAVYGDAFALAASGHEVVLAPYAAAPQSARLVLEPGREALWDWHDLPRELFFDRRLVYS
jgi:hypothetical protein